MGGQGMGNDDCGKCVKLIYPKNQVDKYGNEIYCKCTSKLTMLHRGNCEGYNPISNKE